MTSRSRRMLEKWLGLRSSPKQGKAEATRKRKRSVRPEIQQLEDRTVPATITVTSLADNTTVDGLITLREAIQAANTDAMVDGSTAGSGADSIEFAPSLTSSGDATINLSVVGDPTAGPSAFGITTPVTILGPTGANGITLAGGGGSSNYRFAYVSSAGSLTLENLTISGFRHKGGDGAGGVNSGSFVGGTGGGAAGMGGAIFNNGGALSLVNSSLSGNTAVGGNGGALPTSPGFKNGGGGGGLGGESRPCQLRLLQRGWAKRRWCRRRRRLRWRRRR